MIAKKQPNSLNEIQKTLKITMNSGIFEKFFKIWKLVRYL